MNSREWVYFVPLIIAVLWFGVHPLTITRDIAPNVTLLLKQVEHPLSGYQTGADEDNLPAELPISEEIVPPAKEALPETKPEIKAIKKEAH